MRIDRWAQAIIDEYYNGDVQAFLQALDKEDKEN